MLTRANVLWTAAKRRDLCLERHVPNGGEQLGALDQRIHSVERVSDSGDKRPGDLSLPRQLSHYGFAFGGVEPVYSRERSPHSRKLFSVTLVGCEAAT